MVRTLWVKGLLVFCFALLPAVGLAAEHGGQEHGGAGAAASETTSAGNVEADPSMEAAETIIEAPEVEAPEATPASPPVVPPVLKPITITFSGELMSVDPAGTPPMMAVQDRYGVKKEISVPAEAKITHGAASKSLSDLKTGDKLTVEYTYDVATGKRTAQSISAGEAAPASP